MRRSPLRAALALLFGLVTLVTSPLSACTMPASDLTPAATPVAAASLEATGGVGLHHHHHGGSGEEQLPTQPAPIGDHSAPCAAAVGCVTALAPAQQHLTETLRLVSTAVPDAPSIAITAAVRSPEPPPPRR
jgi:hypothetical protein